MSTNPELHTGSFDDGASDDSSLQPPPANDDVYLGDEEAPSTTVHDQLPSPEEYKARMSIEEGKTPSSAIKKSRAGLYTFLGLLLITIIVTSIAVPLAVNKQKEDEYKSGSRPNTAFNSDPDTGSSGSMSSGSSSSGSSSSGSTSTGSSPTVSPFGSSPLPPPPMYPPTFPPVSSPVSSSDAFPSAASSTTTGNVDKSERLEKTLQYLITSGAGKEEELNIEDSFQKQAANWIAVEDEMQMEIPVFTNSADFHTRFIERWTLALFYYSTGGYTWRYNLHFLEPIDHCEWYETFIDTTGSLVRMGVTNCVAPEDSSETDMVNRIELSNNALTGKIPEEIKNLLRLRDFIVPFNVNLVGNSSLNGLLKLSSLKHLELQYCGFTGTIPSEFGSLGALTFLGLGNNFMTGVIPENFFQLTNLSVLGLDDNLVESPIASFGKLTSIEKLYIEDNLITGQVTEDIIRNGWQNMIDLDLSINQLVGPVPANIWSMPNLEVLDMHGNKFVGAIPEIESPHDKLAFVAMQNNTLEWRIPNSINNLINLAHLDVSDNNLVIPFPSTMNELSNLKSLYTGFNSFEEHPVPTFLESMTNLQELSMKQNKLTGTIPTFMGVLVNLQVLDLDYNQLEGSIPSELGSLTRIGTLMLNRNYLSGSLPDSFANLVDVDILLLDGNNMTGSANVVCKDNMGDTGTTFFSADCGEPNPEIECSCCHLCCNDNNVTCNNFDWRVNLDGIWEYDYQRVVYSFSQNLLPQDAKSDYSAAVP